MENRNIPHIGIVYPSVFPNDFMADILEELKHPALRLDVRREEPKIYAMLEWAVPTAIAVYVLKPYFESFLSEAGKDHYNILKAKIKDLASRSKSIDSHTIVSPQSPKKINTDNNQSKIISLHIQTKSGRVIKLLFDKTLSRNDWNEAIDILLDYVHDDYKGVLQNKLEELAKELKQDANTMYYVVIDKENSSLKFYDDMGILKLQRENAK